MPRHLAHSTNVITIAGLGCSTLGLYVALAGELELAVAIALWAMLAHHLDGVVACRSRNRSSEAAMIGKSLTGFANFVYGAAFPAAVLLQIGEGSLLSLFAALALLVSGAIRLSYCSNFGLFDDEHFLGGPLSYDVPLLAIAFLARPWLPDESFPTLLCCLFLGFAALHVASIRIPAAGGAMYAVITLFSVSASAALTFRTLARTRAGVRSAQALCLSDAGTASRHRPHAHDANWIGDLLTSPTTLRIKVKAGILSYDSIYFK